MDINEIRRRVEEGLDYTYEMDRAEIHRLVNDAMLTGFGVRPRKGWTGILSEAMARTLDEILALPEVE